MKAVVLGATGFIGSHIVRALNRAGISTRIVRRRSSPTLALEGANFEAVPGDLDDLPSLRAAFQGCHVLFHAAGYYPLYSFEGERQRAKARRQMENVLIAAEEAGLERIIYTSSMSTIGRRADSRPADEETPYDPRRMRGLYYEIKYELEQKALAAARRGLPLTIVNPTGVFGDADVKPTSGTLVVQIARRKVPAIFDAKMNVVDARDVAQGELLAWRRGQVGRRYILGGHNTTVGEVARLIARLAGVSPPRLALPLFLGRAAAFASELSERYLFHHDRPLIPRVGIDFLKYGTHYETSRARTELGLETTPMEETFERALSWFRQNRYI